MSEEQVQKQVTVSQVQALLEEGKGRKAIKEELQLTTGQMKILFQHPKLKNAKPKLVAKGFVVIDDTEDDVTDAEQAVDAPETLTGVEQVSDEPQTDNESQESIPDTQPETPLTDSIQTERSNW